MKGGVLMEKFKFHLNVEGRANEAALTRLTRNDCTMTGRYQNDIDWTKSKLNTMLKHYYRIDINLQKGGNSRPKRFVEGEKILFSKIFKEPCSDYNRLRKKNEEDEPTIETYYNKLYKRYQKSLERYDALPKGNKKTIAEKQRFYISRDIQLTIGDETKSPTKEQMDAFGESFLKWFEQRFPQMPVFMAVITYDDIKVRTIKKQKVTINLPPTLHICVLTIAKNTKQNRSGREKEIAWNRCLEQSMNSPKGRSVFLKFREELLRAADDISKTHGFCNERPRGYSNFDLTDK